MEKLVAIRNAYLVQVKGELVAAENLAGRQAPAGEAQDRLNLLRELAGEFRRTQTAIEEEEEDPEVDAALHDFGEEFNVIYYSAMDILESCVVANNNGTKSGSLSSGDKHDDGGDLREAMRLLLEMQRAMMENRLDDFEDYLQRAMAKNPQDLLA